MSAQYRGQDFHISNRDCDPIDGERWRGALERGRDRDRRINWKVSLQERGRANADQIPNLRCARTSVPALLQHFERGCRLSAHLQSQKARSAARNDQWVRGWNLTDGHDATRLGLHDTGQEPCDPTVRQ